MEEKVKVDTDLSAGSEEAVAAKIGTSIEVGKKDTYKVSMDYTFKGEGYTITQWYIGISWEDMGGTCSVWGGHGYAHDCLVRRTRQ